MSAMQLYGDMLHLCTKDGHTPDEIVSALVYMLSDIAFSELGEEAYDQTMSLSAPIGQRGMAYMKMDFESHETIMETIQ